MGTPRWCARGAVPLIVAGRRWRSSDRGIGGTVSDRWHDLTHEQRALPQNDTGRLTETGNVRTIY